MVLMWRSLKKCVLDLHDIPDDFYLLLCGDLNARTASENYNQIQDDYEDNPRDSQDNHPNDFGQQLWHVREPHSKRFVREWV